MADILEMGGKRYRLVEEEREQESPWPFEPKIGMHPSIMIESEDWYANAAVCGLERLFPNRAEADKAAAHLRHVLKSMRLYENAKATGALDSLWHVTGVVEQGRGIWAPEMMLILAQAGRLFATEAEARAFAEGQG